MKYLIQILDVDYFLKEGKPVIRIFGKKPDGQAVCCLFDGFEPYFYVTKNDAIAAELAKLRLKHEEVQRKLPIGYQTNATAVYKVMVGNPQDVPKIRTQLEPHGTCYEADVLFKYRFMVDHGLKGMTWAAVDGDPIKTSVSKVVAIRGRTITPVQRVEDAPLKTLCLDIECLVSDLNRLPDAKRDPIIAISFAFLPTYRNAQSLVLISKPASIEGVQCHRSEKEMLESFVRILEEFDPDVITGYNINGFDLPYLIERLRKFGLSVAMGRCDKPAQVKTFGGSSETEITGRVVVDVYQLLKRDVGIRLPRYTMDAAAKALLGEGKESLKHTEIPQAWAKDVKRLVDYARKDAMLALRLLIERRMLTKFFEIAKISGPVLQECLKGQTARIETMVLHEFKKRDILLPGRPSEDVAQKRLEEKIKGGAVLEPKRGLHVDSVLVLDFQALYPSIIKAYNISIDALLLDGASDVKCHVAPNGARFIDQSIYEGVFPFILKSLLNARLDAKRLMKTAGDDEKRVLDAKQLALKILANSFYGYCGYARARLFRSEIANAVTSYGRESIAKTKTYVEEKFGKEVLYSDTDSLFVKVDTTDLDQAQAYGQEIARAASEAIGLHLEFEKIYRSFLILTKKRYSGWKFERKGDKWEDKVDMRGIETVRRDWCPLVGEVMTTVLNILLKERDIPKATLHTKEVLALLASGKIPLEQLTIVKGVARPIDSYDGVQPHIELAKKMMKRDPATAPKVGDRVGYVITRGSDLLSRRAEDPEYVRQKGLQVDVDYYTNSQLLPPIERIFEVLGIDKGELVGAGKQVSIFDTLARSLSCDACGRAWRRVPLNGLCECGGTIK